MAQEDEKEFKNCVMANLKNFEVFTKGYSKIITAENLLGAVLKFDGSNLHDQIIAVVDCKEGQEFLNDSSAKQEKDSFVDGLGEITNAI